jgi:hypothetical protein
MKILISIIIVNILVFTDLAAQQYSIDSTYSRPLRLYDTTIATLYLNVYGKNWNDSVNVSIKVLFQGKQILYRDLKNVFIAKEYFSKDNFSDYPNCTNYIDYKKYFYSHLIMDIVKSSDNNRYTTSADQLTISVVKEDISKRNKGKSIVNIDQLVDKFMKHLLQGRYDLLWIPEGPFLVSEILVYDRDINSFVNIDIE